MQDYSDLIEEFMTAVKQNYGEKILVQVSFYFLIILVLCVFYIS